jgi:phytoene dehydrogenase-like protein
VSAPDAVVVGAGVNGLVAANLLADRGWEVVVLEAAETPGGAVRTDELTLPGHRHDTFSSFYPFAAASPIIRSLELERHGLTWRRADVVVAHPLRDGRCAALHAEVAGTAGSLEAFAAGDGARWERMVARYVEHQRAGVLGAFYSGFPPLRAGGRLLADLGPMELLRFGRFALTPARRMGEEHFAGEGGPLLLSGNALHGSLTPEQVVSGAFGWLMCMLGQTVGFPVAEGGAARIIEALVARLGQRGGSVRCGCRVAGIEVAGGRATGVRTAGGETVRARRAVLADVFVGDLYGGLLDERHVPGGLRADLEHFHLDDATFKVDWALDGAIPWTAEEARRAGTLHVSDGMDGLSRHGSDVLRHRIPAEPALVMGQYRPMDRTRMPDGAETAWAYTHVPHATAGDAGGDGLTGAWSEDEAQRFADRMEAQVEAVAPGFRSRIRARSILRPRDFHARDGNLVDGAINGGSATLHQMLVFRPAAWHLGRPETPVAGLYLASASAHPGGGVHGVCGANAARAAVWHARLGPARRLLGGRRAT